MRGSSEVGARLDARGMSCERGGKALFVGIDIRADAGTATILLGANGSGKSTLLRTLAGLTEPVAGEVHWDGRPASLRSQSWRRLLAYAGHKPGLKDDLSVMENLTLACDLEHGGVDERTRLDVLDRVGLSRRRLLQVKRLSQGQKQRLTLARLSLSRRPLWLLDEPTAALDADARGLLAGILAEHLARGGVAVVATHDVIDLSGRSVTELRLGD